MKPGDKVWVLYPCRRYPFVECEVVDVSQTTDKFLYRVVRQKSNRVYVAVKQDAFPTREALCEHYRKIFE